MKPSTVSRWIKSLEDANKAPATTSRYRTSLSIMFRWAVEMGYLDHNQVRDARSVRIGSLKKRALSIAEIDEVLERVKGTSLETAYMLSFFAGLRRGEIVEARWEDVDFELDTLQVRGQKTDDSTATLPLHPRMRALLVDVAKKNGAIVSNKHGGHYHPSSLQNLRAQFKGLPGFHLGRHSMATILVRTPLGRELDGPGYETTGLRPSPGLRDRLTGGSAWPKCLWI